jgi:hypothetical protein
MTKGMIYLCLGILALGLVASDPALARRDDDQTMMVSPRVLFLGFSGTRVTIHTYVPYSSVDRESILLYGDGDTPIEPVSVFSDSRGNLVAKFTVGDMATIVSAPRSSLTMTGDYNDGGSFSLSGYVMVKEISRGLWR